MECAGAGGEQRAGGGLVVGTLGRGVLDWRWQEFQGAPWGRGGRVCPAENRCTADGGSGFREVLGLSKVRSGAWVPARAEMGPEGQWKHSAPLWGDLSP